MNDLIDFNSLEQQVFFSKLKNNIIKNYQQLIIMDDLNHSSILIELLYYYLPYFLIYFLVNYNEQEHQFKSIQFLVQNHLNLHLNIHKIISSKMIIIMTLLIYKQISKKFTYLLWYFDRINNNTSFCYYLWLN